MFIVHSPEDWQHQLLVAPCSLVAHLVWQPEWGMSTTPSGKHLEILIEWLGHLVLCPVCSVVDDPNG
jgi:hypothetical protein